MTVMGSPVIESNGGPTGPPTTENGSDSDDFDSVEGKDSGKDDKTLRLKKHPGAPKRFRT